MDTLKKIYRLKEDSVGPPKRYLGATIKRWQVSDEETEKWGTLVDEYLVQAIKNVETKLAKIGKKLSTWASTLTAQWFKPELDVSPVLDAGHTNYYQNLIWHSTVGHGAWLDQHLLGGLSLVSLQCATQARAFVTYLKAHNHSTIVFDNSLPNIGDRFLWQR